ncbi:MAG: cob(I)yrinic acid a,c-diamide adenosyltransferase [Veillonellaceae bacterium]|nr:cob(I)yrinic acid a,c-diamide adenosyltransferase [Veillonellaceae bacterium]
MVDGLILVNTGPGKGKTTAALGIALRAFGNGQKVLILQFIKGAWKYGELRAIERLGDGIAIRQLGDGFVRHNKEDGGTEEFAKHAAKAAEAWREVEREVQSDAWDLVVLDEINYAVDFGLVPVEKVTELLQNKPQRLNMILTGRNARPEVIELADTVTEMQIVKHAYQKGIRARKGIEY